jgi:hypothetical protein
MYRAYKVAAYLGFSVKSAMVNWQQSVGPVAVEFGFKRMLQAQSDMGILTKGSKRGANRTVRDANGERIVFDVVEQVGVKYDDILSQMERGVQQIKDEFGSELIDNPRVKRFIGKLEKQIQGITQKSLENSWVGKYINFVDVEFRNRAVAALAAYDYQMDKYKKQGKTGIEAHNSAIKFARKKVNDINFEYSVFNRPEALRGNLGSAVFLFKSFAINQTQMQFDWFWDVKKNYLKNGKVFAYKKGEAKIPYEHVAKLSRFAFMWMLRAAVKILTPVYIGLIAIESPLAEWAIGFVRMAFGDDEPEETIFNPYDDGGITRLFSGPFSDILNVYLASQDDDVMRQRGVNGLVDGFIPGGKEVRKFYRRNKANGTYIINGEWENIEVPTKAITEMLLEVIAGNYSYQQKEEGLKKLGSTLRKPSSSKLKKLGD